MFADESAVAAQAQVYEPLVADNDALEPQQFVKAERPRPASPIARPQR
jgi:hypothetical protein